MRASAQKPQETQRTTSAKSAIPSQAHPGQGSVVNSILHLQRTIGNQAVLQLLKAHAANVEGDSTVTKNACFGHDFSQIPASAKAPVKAQTKLTVNTPGDVSEQEAGRIADQVMATPVHHAVSGAPPHIQRLAEQPIGQADAAPRSIDQTLASPGRPLEPALRQDMEQRFGHDFSRVRVHSGGAAEQSALDVNAHAYTVGQNIVFGVGRFAPGTHEGRRLIAHELTHVVQQSGADGNRTGQSIVQRQMFPTHRSGCPYPGVATTVEAPCPGTRANAVTIVRGDDARFGLKNPKNVGTCPIAIGSTNDERRPDIDPDRILELWPGESRDCFSVPPDTVAIKLVCFDASVCPEGRGVLQYDSIFIS